MKELRRHGVGETLRKAGVKKKEKRVGPVWRGPCEDGVTQSLLSTFLFCRERFRLLVVEGLCPKEGFIHRLEYGNMWHLCEEKVDGDWRGALREYCRDLCRQYPLDQENILKWYNVCETQFVVYLDYLKKHPNKQKSTAILKELVFKVPYKLPSGRVVFLRGKMDGVESDKKDKKGLRLQEHKTKGDIREDVMQAQLQFDLQTMFYLVALETLKPKNRIVGVRYNVIRRPLSGGKHTIKPLAAKEYKTKPNVPAETPQAFYNRLGGLIKSDPEFFFMQWMVNISKKDITVFKETFLNPVLENLCNWWEWIATHEEPFRRGNEEHWRTPFGLWNPLAQGRPSELDNYLANGDTTGLHRVENLFGELA